MKQNEVGKNRDAPGSNLAGRLEKIVAEVSSRIGFTEPKMAGASSWWGSKSIGAARYRGYFNGRPAVMKVQGVKQQTSEAYMISEFARYNTSALIRPPHLYLHLPWDEAKQYEIIVHEAVDGQKVVNVPATKEEIEHFFKLYAEYRDKTRSHPWIERPTGDIAKKVSDTFTLWQKSSDELYPMHRHRKPEDSTLINEAVEILKHSYTSTDLEFVHAHFSTDDLLYQDEHVVVFSNLYWSWRPPFYDIALPYHWHIYHQARAHNANPEQVDRQHALWWEHLERLPEQLQIDKKFLYLALLERAAAGLILDALTVDTASPIAEYLVELTRTELNNLIARVSS